MAMGQLRALDGNNGCLSRIALDKPEERAEATLVIRDIVERITLTPGPGPGSGPDSRTPSSCRSQRSARSDVSTGRTHGAAAVLLGSCASIASLLASPPSVVCQGQGREHEWLNFTSSNTGLGAGRHPPEAAVGFDRIHRSECSGLRILVRRQPGPLSAAMTVPHTKRR